MAKYYGDGAEKELCQMIKRISSKSAWEVFSDFVAMSAISISNAVDGFQAEDREKEYLELIGRYKKQEQLLFPEMLAHLVNGLEDEVNVDGPTDILGKVYHSLELHNKWHGQFFTPQNICDMMAKMSLGEYDQSIKKYGYITLCEPCCGAGGMILGFAKAMKKNDYNYCSQMLATAMDIDLKCVHMCYLQLSLCGIPAVVVHGNTLTTEEWSHWYTPAYIWGGWNLKEKGRLENRDRSDGIEAKQESNKIILSESKVEEKQDQKKAEILQFQQMSFF